MSLQICNDTTEAVELCERYALYLKPLWKVKISVQLPVLKTPGQAISSWKVMEKLRNMVKPDEFISLKVSKTNLVLIQFEAEVEKKVASKRVLQKLQSNTMKLSGFPEVLKIRAAPAKINYPTRHDWDSFFRDAKNLDEMKPGERPDTIYIQNLPTKWFAERNSSCDDKPSEHVLKRVFESFGDVRRVAIPCRKNAENGTFGKVSTFSQELVFDGYVQYKEYISFVKAMDSLKGMKLLLMAEGGKAHLTDIKVDFDKTRYLSDQAIKQRLVEEREISEKQLPVAKKEISEFPIVKVQKKADRHISTVVPQMTLTVKQAASHDKEQSSNPVKQAPSSVKEVSTKTVRQQAHPEKQPSAAKVSEIEESKLRRKAKAVREREAKFMMKELLYKSEMAEMERRAKEKEKQIAKERHQQQRLLERSLEEEKKRKEEEERSKQKCLQEQERVLREKLLKSLKMKEQKRTEELREKLRKEIGGKKKPLKSVLVLAPRESKPENHYHLPKRLKS